MQPPSRGEGGSAIYEGEYGEARGNYLISIYGPLPLPQCEHAAKQLWSQLEKCWTNPLTQVEMMSSGHDSYEWPNATLPIRNWEKDSCREKWGNSGRVAKVKPNIVETWRHIGQRLPILSSLGTWVEIWINKNWIWAKYCLKWRKWGFWAEVDTEVGRPAGCGHCCCFPPY